ncbi:MAG: hypothetical protein ACM3QZ_11965 [Solirubrobacterales bacterium]
MSLDWFNTFSGAISVCDADFTTVAMNEKAAQIFEKSGGTGLIGKNLLDCHPEPAQEKLRAILATGKPNVYTIEKNGIKKLLYQAPLMEAGVCKGLIELILELPEDMPHFKRD